MNRLWNLSIALTCLSLCSSLMGQEKVDKHLTFLDAKEAGPDFQIQGEYVGKLGDQPVGVQLIARGNGKFDAVTFSGGLPGAGFDSNRNEKLYTTFETKDGVTKAAGDGFEAIAANGTITVHHSGRVDEMKKLHRESATLAKTAPEGAIVLFNGTSVDEWEPGKMEANGLMGVGTKTKKSFEDYTLHLEFRTPFMPLATGQGRGNSGMYLGDQYECQILDSFGLEGADNECGGIYQNAKPKVNMCFPPLSWQTYDVEFTCAKFDATGNVTTPARTTIRLNNVVIHDNLELRVTPGGGRADQKPGPLFLQNHGDAVRFRNIWLIEKK